MKKKNKIWITGYGMVGKSLIKNLLNNSYYEVLRTKRSDFNQINQIKTKNWIIKNKPDTIIITSALVGGIHINSRIPADFLYENSMINLNIINAAHENGCKKIVFLGASCMYPKFGKQPFKEELIFDGKIEETNEGYGLSKILGLKFIEMLNKQYKSSHLSIIPAASYGPNDCYDEQKNHVIPALIKKFHESKTKNKKNIKIWGTGNIKREFIHVDDMADGIMHIIKNYKDKEPINLGTGEEISIKNLSLLIQKVVGYEGQVVFDNTKPDGIKRKILDNSKIKKLKWKPKIPLKEGLEQSYKDFLKNIKK
jgi:GDP-L-fucose synthase|tara:strand:+ start:1225 stop:2154 length:930 start_codon:yes stop_codon:yes gene_type:complete